MPRKDISYSTYKIQDGARLDRRGNPLMISIYQFYPDDVWDEDKLTRAEAEKKYPASDWRWVKHKD